MQNWEYKVEESSSPLAQSKLNQIGGGGWELAAVERLEQEGTVELKIPFGRDGRVQPKTVQIPWMVPTGYRYVFKKPKD